MIERITTITDARRLDHKVAGDRFSGDKLFKALRAANRDASDSFRECCAADAVRYHRELVSRLGGGKHDEQFYQWADMLLKPLHSKEWKRARDDEDGKLGDLIYELSQMQRDLLKIDLRLINSMRQ